ncbi:hypothetical protein [Candidatus Clostridium radicumherbarum]|uniref:Uncharacterized protein n=1 Tax=Candidatus Clostridium radicumherbarum TaxID=3381662 RepID=A0ABW8TWE2_9CLOT
MRGFSRVTFSFLIGLGLLFSMFFVFGYSNPHNYVRAKETNVSFEHKEPTKLRPLTLEQINNFVKERGITPIVTKNIKNYTVILHETNSARGYYALTSNQNGKIQSEGSGSGGNNANLTPVSIGLSGGSDNIDGTYSFYSFAWVIINDSSVLDKASWATLILDDNTAISESVSGNRGIIISNTMGNSKATNLIIYDKNREVLFIQKL